MSNRIDNVMALMKQVRSDPGYAEWLKEHGTIAERYLVAPLLKGLETSDEVGLAWDPEAVNEAAEEILAMGGYAVSITPAVSTIHPDYLVLRVTRIHSESPQPSEGPTA